MKTAILGLGNLLLGDEGVGLHAARVLATAGLGSDVEVIEGGTVLLETLWILEEAERVIVVDAVRGGEPPGTVYRLPLEHFALRGCVASMHGFDVFRALALAGRANPPDIVVVGVEPAIMGWSAELSAPVAGALPRLVEAVRAEACAGAIRPPASPSPPERSRRLGFRGRRSGSTRKTRAS